MYNEGLFIPSNEEEIQSYPLLNGYINASCNWGILELSNMLFNIHHIRNGKLGKYIYYMWQRANINLWRVMVIDAQQLFYSQKMSLNEL